MISEVYFNFNEFTKAILYGSKYLNYAKLDGNKADEQRAYVTLGRTYFALASSPSVTKEDMESALRSAQKAYKRSWDLIDSITKNVTKFELMEMKAVVRLNQGLVEEMKGQSEEALDSYESAIDICRKNDIFDTLYRCYISLGNFYSSQCDTENALRNFSLSLNIVEKLPDKAESAWTSHAEKVKVYFGMASFTQAKTEMLKARQLPIENDDVKKDIKKMLKQANSLCRAERELLATPERDYKARKALFERLGDKLSAMGYYAVAVRYYLQMLESARKAGDEGKDLCAIYVSLSQTYRDDKQYDKAIEFYKKELELWADNPREASKTCLNLGDALEESNGDYYDVLEHYMNARCYAVRAGSKQLEANALEYMIDLYKNNQRDSLAAETQKERDLIDVSDDEDTNTTDNKTPADDDESSSDEGDDEEDEVEADTRRSSRSVAPKLKICKNEKGETALHRACIDGNINKVRALVEQGHPVNVRDNAGWIPLHEACNHDRREIVSYLLDRGAAIDDPGKAECDGTTPLIDAAMCGHVGIMELLIDRGAALLLKSTNGETALDCLLSWYRRSNADKLPQEFINQFQEVEDKLRKALIKAGYRVPPKSTWTTARQLSPPPVEVPAVPRSKRPTQHRQPDEPSKRTKPVGNLRRTLDTSLNSEPLRFNPISSDEGSDTETRRVAERYVSTQTSASGAADEYVNVMKSVRHRVSAEERTAPQRVEAKERTAFLEPGLDPDQWLEDDLAGTSAKRRKTDAPRMEYLANARKALDAPHSSDVHSSRPITTQFLITSESTSQSRPRRYSSSSDSNDQITSFDVRTDFVDLTNLTQTQTFDDLPDNNSEIRSVVSDFNSDDDFDFDFPTNRFKAPSQTNRKRQSSLLRAGFSRNRSSPQSGQPDVRARNVYPPIPLNSRAETPSRAGSALLETNRSGLHGGSVRGRSETLPREGSLFNGNAPARSETQPVVQPPQAQPTQSLSIKIRVEGKLFLVPIVPEQKISFLAEEASKRYYSIAGVKPTLSLSTSDGALLAPDDPVSLIVGSAEVLSTVVAWNMPSLTERYAEACATLRVPVDVRAQRSLAGCEGNQVLTLSDLAMSARQLAPVFRALHAQDRVWRVDVSGNLLRDEGMKLLSECVARMKDLKELNVSCNYVTSQGLRHLSNLFREPEATRPLQSLTWLDLSFNLLGRDPSLTQLTALLEGAANLKTLILQSCELSSASFDCATGLMPPLLCLDSIENLDISFNALGRDGVAGFLGRLSTDTLVSLNLAATSLPDSIDSAVARELKLFLQRENPDNLRSLNLSNNFIDDADVSDILQSLERASKFESLILSNNSKITSTSVKMLLSKDPPLVKVDLTGCGGVCDVGGVDEPLFRWVADNSDSVSVRLRGLTLSVADEKRVSDVEQMWGHVWRERAVVNKGPCGLLQLTLN